MAILASASNGILRQAGESPGRENQVENASASPTLLDRYEGCLLGLACGDAVGTTVEFRTPGTFTPLTDMVGGGPFNLAPGQWTDDTSMALCLAEITGTGYSVASLEAALWCFHTHHDFASTILAAANLGDDADTTAAIVGQLAGAFYGVGAIPEDWLHKLHMRSEIQAYATRLAGG